ncbi:MAG: hypothetical protein CSA34_04585 [Desulfobulbus propionicus]|nr:MAG: hypothetical protein CSA34_04585 [Desulfobulbus propionicus]
MLFSPVLIWFLVGTLFFATELALPGFIVFFFGIGAWTVSLAVYLVELPLAGQLALFLVASLVSLLALRRWLYGIFQGDRIDEADSVNMVPEGATGEVIRAITPPGLGKIKYGGSFWEASCDQPVAEGTIVRILEKKDLVVRVCPVQTDTEEK